MNEAWILSGEKGEANQQWEGSRAEPQKHEEKDPNGKLKATWGSRTGANGAYVLHGTENWYYPDGRKKYQVTYQDGKKTGRESFWLPGEVLMWSRDHRPDGVSVWTQYWPGGQKRVESSWRGFKAEGVATQWTRQGKVRRQVTFKDGALVEP